MPIARKRSNTNALPYNLGELELNVLQLLWRDGSLDAAGVLERLSVDKRPSLNTVQSTLERLRKKDLVGRSKLERRFLYEARYTRPELLGRMMGGVIKLLHDGKLETILSSFVSAAETMDEDSLDYLSDLIASKKAGLSGDDHD